MNVKLCIAQDPEADALLSSSALALLFGMMLDQQIPMEKAFKGPKDIADRMDGELNVHRVAETDPVTFTAIVAATPAIHRFPKSMAARLQALAKHLVDHYGGNAEAIWTDNNPNGKEVLRRLKMLPGFGDQKARIFLSLLGKQLEVQLEGWQEAAGTYGEADSRRSVADVVNKETLDEVRAFKRRAKAEKLKK